MGTHWRRTEWPGDIPLGHLSKMPSNYSCFTHFGDDLRYLEAKTVVTN